MRVAAQFCDIALAKMEGFLQPVAYLLKIQLSFVQFKCALGTYLVLISLQTVKNMPPARRDAAAEFLDIVTTGIL